VGAGYLDHLGNYALLGPALTITPSCDEWGLYLASDEAPLWTWASSPSRGCSSTSADQFNSVAPLATILNDVAAFRVWRASLNLHCLFAHEAAQEVSQGAFIVVQMKSSEFGQATALAPV
jgi:hypothetical protein